MSDPVLITLVLGLSAVLGIALQIGSTCAVLATQHLVVRRRPERFLSFFECACWAVLTLWVFGAYPILRPDWSAWSYVLAGGALFGAGAWINNACAFGTVSQLGAGHPEYLLTPLGSLIGARIVLDGMADMSGPMLIEVDSRMPAPVAAVLLVGFLTVRAIVGRHRLRAYMRLALGMMVVGVCFTLLGYLHQPFPWTNLVAFHDTATVLSVGAVLVMLGAAAGTAALTQRRWRVHRPEGRAALRCLLGGAAMGAGAMLVPGGNDSMLLYGMPSGAAQAFGAYVAMCLTIAVLVALRAAATPKTV
ncbi:YeeE/YedE thiosulfate transporter family protein [Sulfitobacter sp. S190]|uniref:YeeE/YedE thiosulfate transporter family protein n=1 Tax=Sulfitobacter sp. S190 TaxID=2867022 RepID=UPI0021A69B41|nr:YeeE/YedE thiosulfate transporter family protein [Sulfitobacter sp. S190]UWR23187.1 YeeE/YedE family protein [Sulfitobacter sp. S190]